jgi:hypothetical protein
MATLIDTDGEVIAETSNLTMDDLVEDTPTEDQVAPDEYEDEQPPEDAPEEDALPEKYQGKSASDIARMHQELEKRLGQQSSEVGELRAAFDEMVKGSMAAQQAPTPEVTEVDDVDFFADPKEAMRRAIANDPSVRQAQEMAVLLQKEKALTAIQAKHADMKDILGSESFQTWVKGSQFRQNLFAQADANYDFAAADELLTLYKDTQGVVKSQAAVEKVAKKAEIKRASTGSSRSNPESSTTRKVYRRRDIIELMNRNPKRYEAIQPEIMKAYQEGRVK